MGYDGNAHIDGKKKMIPIAWSGIKLRVRDRVGFLVTRQGDAWIVENGVPKTSLPERVPTDAALYAVVDLLGRALAVRICQDALPPKALPALASGTFVFDRRLVSNNVVLSADGLTARHKDASGDELQGVVFSSVPIPVLPTGDAYFEVEITAVREGQDDGLAIGITTTLPKPSDEKVEIAEMVPNSWSLGYDGRAHVHGKSGMIPSGWGSSRLKVGDRVGIFITYDGVAWVVENDEKMAAIPGEVPTGVPLYAIVDLLGSALAVSLLPQAKPPAYIVLHAMANPQSEVCSFHPRLVSRQVQLSAMGMVARHMDPSGDEMEGVIYTKDPIPVFPEGAYFEVQIRALRSGEEDAIAIGVTPALPSPYDDPVEIAEAVPRSWSMGYDGRAHIDGNANMIPIPWDGRHLRVDDRVGILVTSRGEAWILENGEPKASLPARVPTGVPLYAFVDLLGNTLGVSIPIGFAPPHGIKPGK
mmetsp:Transcript_41724/g.78023  ORF Transcript_41724/g.78023 Transcript_41724/m.78023 type:complete len:473 (-) Transcript_41724:158-1576(-)